MKTEALIIGGGIAGQTLAALLGGAGLDVCLVDSQPRPAKGKKGSAPGRTVALMNSSINVIQQTGIWKAIEPLSTPLRVMRIIDDSSPNIDPVTLSFSSREIEQDQFGFNIPNDELRAALSDYLEMLRHVTVFSPASLSTFHTDGQKVYAALEDGQTITANLIIGTDGRGSLTRSLAGIEVEEHDYGQIAMTCLIDHTRAHDFTSTEFHRPGGPFTVVPMPGNRCSVVWVEKTDDAQEFLSLKKQAFEKALQDRSRGMLGKITLASDPESWPLKLVKAKALTAPRVALAAEAAHVISPIGAQGLNLSLRDVAELAETLIDAARLGEDTGSLSVLNRYAARRRTDIATRVTGIDGLNRIVSNNLVFLRGLRRMGLKSLEAIPPLKNLAMHQGLAPGADQGRLLKGEPL
jgi:2-octaprenyl-6-methoxyphenol hydroxylase